MAHNEEIVIVAAKRTPIGSLLGKLSSLSAPALGAIAHRAAITQAGVAAQEIDAVISGCVLPAGIGQAPARQAAILAGIPNATGAITINKMCGSGLQAVMLAHDLLLAGSHKLILASGMESMSNAPYLLAKARKGYRLGHGELQDHMLLDGLEDAYDRGKPMGYFAEATARHYNFSRKEQDEYAMRSLTRALQAQQNGIFEEEIAAVTLIERQAEVVVKQDEGIDANKLAKIPNLKPVFKADGTVTAANSSSIADGAASLMITTASYARQHGLRPLARIIAHAGHAQEPQWFTTAPIEAIRKLLNKVDWRADYVDLYEINEAFAVVAMVAIQQLQLEADKVNVHGGACVLGHPIGASGARILVTLLNALQLHKKTRGIAALCIGGGEAVAVAVELNSAIQ